MSTVVLIAMEEDEPHVRKIVEALLADKLDLWWERPEAGEGGWDRSVKMVMDARAVVFFWSAASLGEGGGAYRALANRALAADKALSARLQRVSVPEAFRKATCIDLSGWRFGAKDVFLLDLASAAKAKASGLDPPPLRGPARRMFRRVAIAFPTVLFSIGLATTFKSFYADLGLNRLATQQEKRDWAALHPGSCADLRVFLARHVHGIHVDDAKTMLSARRDWVETQWRPMEKPLPLYVTRGSAEARPDQSAARSFAEQRAAQQAVGDCQSYAAAGSFRVVKATPQVSEWLCEPVSGGEVCGARGNSVCRLLEQQAVTREACGPLTDNK